MEVSPTAREDNKMLTCEVEAAEALAELSRCSAVDGGAPLLPVVNPTTEDQATDIPKISVNSSIMGTSGSKTEVTVTTVHNQSCSTAYRSMSASKLRHNLSEAEKEDRRLRRVLANRESARQTIRRRQAMHLELTRKETDLLKENENLKKEKELAVNEYNALKDTNVFLKAQMAGLKKTETRKLQEVPLSSQAGISGLATNSTSVILHDQPSVVPFFWPSFFPSFQFQCASHSDMMSLQGQEGPRTPLYVLPVPCVFPILTHSNTLNSQCGANERQNETSSTHRCSVSSSSDTFLVGGSHNLSSNQNKGIGTSSSTKFTFRAENSDRWTGHHSRNSNANGNHDVASSHEHISEVSLKKNKEPNICYENKSENAFAATTARRKRKELMKLKNVQGHHDHLHF